MNKSKEFFILGIFIAIGLCGLGYFLSDGIVTFKKMDRTVNVKGLAEMEVPADVAIWPISFKETSDDLNALYTTIKKKTATIKQFLKKNGFEDSEISTSSPSIVDYRTNPYIEASKVMFRYSSEMTVTVYTSKVDQVIKAMAQVGDLVEDGIAVAGDDYRSRTQFLFNGLNEIKPQMIEEATKNAREAAEKFAKDSDSELGKIKNASQGQFTIRDRDSNTPQIKMVRVVSTVNYYLSD